MWSAGFYLTCYLACYGYYGTWIKLNWIELNTRSEYLTQNIQLVIKKLTGSNIHFKKLQMATIHVNRKIKKFINYILLHLHEHLRVYLKSSLMTTIQIKLRCVNPLIVMPWILHAIAAHHLTQGKPHLINAHILLHLHNNLKDLHGFLFLSLIVSGVR
jgi:hypothetical protein